MAKVSLVAGENRRDNIQSALALISDELRVRGRVLIKPNLSGKDNPAAVTDVSAVDALIEFLNAGFPGLDITVGEGSGGTYLAGKKTRSAFERFGYYSLKRHPNVRIADFDDWEDYSKLQVRMIKGTRTIRILRHDFDYVISLSLPKTHDFAIMTAGIKNMMGTVHRYDRIYIHGLRGRRLLQHGRHLLTYMPSFIARPIQALGRWWIVKIGGYGHSVKVTNVNLTTLAMATKLDLVVLDALDCMEGEGPIWGEPIHIGLAVASTDPLKADGVAARLMGLDPADVGYLYYLQRVGYGDYSLDGLVGEPIEKHRRRFRMHPCYDLQRNWREETEGAG